MADFSARSGVNLSFLAGWDYLFINHLLPADSWLDPVGSAYATTTKTWMQCLDANGWPNDPTARTAACGGGFRVPDPANFGGPYILDWVGDGEFTFTSGTWTATPGANVTVVGNGHYKNTAAGTPGATSSVTLTLTGPTGNPLLIGLHMLSDIYSASNYVTSVRFYRSADATDLAAGKVFRSAWKNEIVGSRPSFVRTLNWTSGVSPPISDVRFENRRLPGCPGYAGGNWKASPAYGETTGSNNIYSLASATGMPASMTHGEIVTCRIGSGMVKAGTGPVSVTGITNATNGVVTTSTAHGYSTGDVIVHVMPSSVMKNLHWLPCTITVLTTTTYQLNVNTTSFGAYSGTASSMPYVSLNVGARGDYPVILSDCGDQAAAFGNSMIATHDYKTFYFDKTIAGKTDGSGNYVTGAWIMFRFAGNDFGPNSGVPLEIITALINELNAAQVAAGDTTPIGLWLNLPPWHMNSGDPDYSSGSNFATGAIGVVQSGANGYPGLTGSAPVFVEYTNEIWN